MDKQLALGSGIWDWTNLYSGNKVTQRGTQPPTDAHLDVLVFFLLLLQDLQLLKNRLLLEFSPFNLRA